VSRTANELGVEPNTFATQWFKAAMSLAVLSMLFVYVDFFGEWSDVGVKKQLSDGGEKVLPTTGRVVYWLNYLGTYVGFVCIVVFYGIFHVSGDQLGADGKRLGSSGNAARIFHPYLIFAWVASVYFALTSVLNAVFVLREKHGKMWSSGDNALFSGAKYPSYADTAIIDGKKSSWYLIPWSCETCNTTTAIMQRFGTGTFGGQLFPNGIYKAFQTNVTQFDKAFFGDVIFLLLGGLCFLSLFVNFKRGKLQLFLIGSNNILVRPLLLFFGYFYGNNIMYPTSSILPEDASSIAPNAPIFSVAEVYQWYEKPLAGMDFFKQQLESSREELINTQFGNLAESDSEGFQARLAAFKDTVIAEDNAAVFAVEQAITFRLQKVMGSADDAIVAKKLTALADLRVARENWLVVCFLAIPLACGWLNVCVFKANCYPEAGADGRVTFNKRSWYFMASVLAIHLGGNFACAVWREHTLLDAASLSHCLGTLHTSATDHHSKLVVHVTRNNATLELDMATIFGAEALSAMQPPTNLSLATLAKSTRVFETFQQYAQFFLGPLLVVATFYLSPWIASFLPTAPTKGSKVPSLDQKYFLWRPIVVCALCQLAYSLTDAYVIGIVRRSIVTDYNWASWTVFEGSFFEILDAWRLLGNSLAFCAYLHFTQKGAPSSELPADGTPSKRICAWQFWQNAVIWMFLIEMFTSITPYLYGGSLDWDARTIGTGAEADAARLSQVEKIPYVMGPGYAPHYAFGLGFTCQLVRVVGFYSMCAAWCTREANGRAKSA
jgi:hypothetical protein